MSPKSPKLPKFPKLPNSPAIGWTRHYVRQEDGLCGPAVIKMILSAVGVDKSQAEIAAATFLPWWGTATTVMVAYLSRFFSKLGFKIDANIKDIELHLRQRDIVVVDWWNDLDGDPNDPPDGHYSIAAAIDKGRGTIKLIDPSAKGIWEMKLSDFAARWFDYLDVDQKIRQPGWLLWLAPASVKK